MAITERSSDFTNRDFDSWIDELQSKVSSVFPGWTDFNIANFGNILLEMFAHTLDVSSFTQDQQHKERFVTLATLQRSMILLGKNFSYALPGSAAATVDLEFTIADGNPRVNDITIPADTFIRTAEVSENISFRLLSDAVITAGDIQSGAHSAENSEATSIDFIGTGQPGQILILPALPYIDESADIVVSTFSYTEVDNFLNSGPADRHFVVDIDEEQTATVRFGDGINGLPPAGSGIVNYKVGGGFSGNVEANSLSVFVEGSRFQDSQGNEVQILVRNPSNASGGLDRMSVEEARVAIPASIRTAGERSVTSSDFEDNARLVRGVARSLMMTSDDDPIIPENEGKLYIVPVGGGVPSAQLKTDVEDFINNERPPTLTFSFTVEDPIFKIIPVTAEVFLNQGVSEADARSAVEDSLDEFFSLVDENGAPNEQIDFGRKIRNTMPIGTTTAELPWSDIFNAIRDARTSLGVLAFRKIEQTSVIPATDVPIADTEFPVLGAIQLLNGDTATFF
jgi:hypothetical protein